ncbi:hypothetical protein NE237_013669 [Protea cynaroides]|uniref:Uncharacterized protein n=1 Tax=Protea cynaroides TaxID=273540 RepID=A0A9Q0GZ58_9MAGN|nr:hypothetical protein NE237_013669 [Protea cynaroides]
MEREVPIPHVLIFPFPFQGHVNSMLKLAELLCSADFYITFLNSNHNHKRLLPFTDAEVRFRRWPKFRFETITDSLPADDPRFVERIFEMFDASESIIREIPPLSCVIADGIIPFAIDVADEFKIPIISFRTLPFQGDMDVVIKCVPRMEGFLHRRDLPSFCRAEEFNGPIFFQFNGPMFQSLLGRLWTRLEHPASYSTVSKTWKVPSSLKSVLTSPISTPSDRSTPNLDLHPTASGRWIGTA